MMSDLAQGITRYLVEGLLPLWAGPGRDAARGGFHERLNAERRPLPLDYCRLTVCGRQLFVFSRAAGLGAPPEIQRVAHRIYEEMTERFWDRRHGGWLFKTDLAGQPLDPQKDLYAHAFVLFGLAHYYDCYRRPEALALARSTSDLLKRHLLLPSGWFASSAGADWTVSDRALNQNPHMHLLEAYISLYRASGDAEFKREAERLIELFHARLFDPATGILGEFFDDAGRVHPETGHRVEPGHHFEWSWLLHEFAGMSGDERSRPAAEALLRWASRCGIDSEHGGIFDQVDRSGAVIADTKRIWPLTECVKAYVARYRASRDAANRERALGFVDFLFAHYLLPDGGWREILRRDLSPHLAEMPATTCYHIFLGLTEALSVLAADA